MEKRVIRFNAAQVSWLTGKSVHRASELIDKWSATEQDGIKIGRTKAIDAAIVYKKIKESRIYPQKKEVG